MGFSRLPAKAGLAHKDATAYSPMNGAIRQSPCLERFVSNKRLRTEQLFLRAHDAEALGPVPRHWDEVHANNRNCS
jgi:hypothetical protein